MNPAEVLKAAWAAVSEAELPRELHEVAFREAVRMYTFTTAPIGSVTPHNSVNLHFDDANEKETSAEHLDNEVPSSEFLDTVSRGTGVPWKSLEALIYVEDGEPRLDLPAIKLGGSTAERTRNIAAILTIARTFGLDENETSVELIREEAQRLKCYDRSNFNAHLKGLEGFAIRESGGTRKIVAKAGGLDEFPKLVEVLVGNSAP